MRELRPVGECGGKKKVNDNLRQHKDLCRSQLSKPDISGLNKHQVEEIIAQLA